MKLALLGDIHGNLNAFLACLAYAKHLDAQGYVFLGDLITDGPDPRALLRHIGELAHQKPCWFVRGNREQMILNHHRNPGDGWRASAQTGSLLYTYERLGAQEIAFLGKMLPTEQICLDDCPPLLACHASPEKNDEPVYPGTTRADAILQSLRESVLLAGHTHTQFRYETRGKQMINPGAVGLHQNGRTAAQFALLQCEQGRWKTRMLSVEYDRAAELRRLDESELPQMAGVYYHLIRRSIALGDNLIKECLTRAQELAQAEPFQMVADSFWASAAKELGVI